MIENKTEYKILEFILNRKLNLYFFVFLFILSRIFYANTIYSLYFGFPFITMYELLILLMNYDRKHKHLFYISNSALILFLVGGVFSKIILNFVDVYLIVFILRLAFNFLVHVNKGKNILDNIYYQFLFSPVFIHTQKENILNLIKDRYKK